MTMQTILPSYGPLPTAMILRPQFGGLTLLEQQKIAAGAAAFKRALQLGYSRIVADSMRRTAKREHFPGETPEATAHRIVPRMQDSATQRPTMPPRGAA